MRAGSAFLPPKVESAFGSARLVKDKKAKRLGGRRRKPVTQTERNERLLRERQLLGERKCCRVKGQPSGDFVQNVISVGNRFNKVKRNYCVSPKIFFFFLLQMIKENGFLKCKHSLVVFTASLIQEDKGLRV